MSTRQQLERTRPKILHDGQGESSPFLFRNTLDHCYSSNPSADSDSDSSPRDKSEEEMEEDLREMALTESSSPESFVLRVLKRPFPSIERFLDSYDNICDDLRKQIVSGKEQLLPR